MILVTNNEGACGVGETARRLAAGERVLDAIEAGIKKVEADESVRTVGRGGWPNLLGEIELDAAMMDGDTLRSGAVGAIKGFAHPITIAREVMNRLPHELIVGAGAERFGREIGAAQWNNLVDDSREAWERWFANKVEPQHREQWEQAPLAGYCKDAIDPETGKDTTVFIAMDSGQSVGSGVSTSGWGWKYPGRLGDSPVVGAGSYADSRYGAAACTGAGEMAIRVSAARSAVLYMKKGASVRDALLEVADDMRGLRGGLIDRITLHAIDCAGNHQAIAVNAVRRHHYWYWDDTLPAPEKRYADQVVL